MTSRERVKRAINMQRPDHIPILFFNKDQEQSDIILIDVERHFIGENKDISEWGFKWERLDKTMGMPKDALIDNIDEVDKYVVPNPYDARRFEDVDRIKGKYGKDKYYLASLALTGFTVMTFIRGFAAVLEDLYINKEQIGRLADMVFNFEEDIIRQLKSYGFDGVAFFDDWGTQENLMISPGMWREFFKPRYRKQFKLAHEEGLDVYFHCCGKIDDIIPDFIEIGVDMLNLSQPNIFDIEQIGKDWGGKVCFVCPVSYQTTSISGTKEEIYNDVKRLMDNFGCFNGGLIGYIEEYSSIGMTDENYWNCANAFKELGKYKSSTGEVKSDENIGY